MKSFIFSLILSLVIVSLALAGGEPVPQNNNNEELILEDFAAGVLDNNWWRFGNLKDSFAVPENPAVGKFYLKLSGVASDWFAGGRGFYVAKDASKFNAIEFWLLGQGVNSGKIKVELFDDDNNNMGIEQDKDFKPINDDKLEYEMKINWKGWKKVVIPFKSFIDTNPGIGNDKWDPKGFAGSGGLIQVQFIFVASSESGMMDTGLGKISLVKQDEKK
ncbi:MAG: hypothetical protein KKA19_07710 [Candidatus Margulisbacteria bacterium]|nr:hypothetical protein [Candidatus Margulisiibacteriota bacterium]